MKKIKHIAATSHIDKDGDKLTKESLESLVETITNYYLPANNNHDNRKPVGRYYKADLVTLEDGEFGVQVEGEIFEPSDTIENISNLDKTIQPHEETHGFLLSFDPRFNQNEHSMQIINNLSNRLNSTTTQQINKSLTYEEVLLITIGTYILGGIAQGFLKSIGSDLYSFIKSQLIDFFHSKDESSFLEFGILVKHPETNYIFEINIRLKNKSENELNDLYQYILYDLDNLLENKLKMFLSRIHTLYLTFENNQLIINYMLDKYAIPILFNK